MVVVLVAVDAVAWVIIAAGVAKAMDPAPLGASVLALGVRAPRSLLRSFGLVEVMLGAAVLLDGSRPLMGALAFVYVVFALALVLVSRRTDRASCGCFGARGASAGWVGVTANLLSAAVAFVAVISPSARAGEIAPALASVPIGVLLIVLHTTGAEFADGLRRLRDRDGWRHPVPIAVRG